jgi:hypothetical protein
VNAIALILVHTLVFATNSPLERPVPDSTRHAATLATLKDSLIDLEQQSWVAWKKRDGTYFDRQLADDHVEVAAGGVSNKATVVAFVGSGMCVVEDYALSDFSMTQLDVNTAVLTYHAIQTTKCHGIPLPSPAWATSVYIRRDNRWLNAVFQQTFTGSR